MSGRWMLSAAGVGWRSTLILALLAAAGPLRAADKSPAVLEPTEFQANPKGLPADELEVRDLAFSPDGKRLAAAHGKWDTQGIIRVYDRQTKELLKTFEMPRGIASITYSPDGRWLAAGVWDHSVRIWDAATLNKVRQFTPGNHVARIAFSPDSKRLATATEASELMLWDTSSWQMTHQFDGELFRFQQVAFSLDGKLLCGAGGSFAQPRFGRAAVFEVESGKQKYVMNAGDAPMGSVAFSPDGQTIATGSFDGNIYLWNSDTGRQQQVLSDTASRGSIERVAYSKDGKQLIAAGGQGAVQVWNPNNGNSVARLQMPASVLTVAFDAESKQFASGGADKLVRIWDAASRKELHTLEPIRDAADVPSEVLAVAVSPDGRWLASSHEDRTVRLRKADDGAVVRSIEGHEDVVAGLAFSPDSKWLATASYDRLVKLWSVESAAEPRVLKGHTNWVFAAEFSPDGKWLATSGYDKTIRLWDVAEGKELAVLNGHTATVRALAFAPDGKRLASGSADRTVRLWDLATKVSVAELKGHTGAIRAVAFSPDGATVASGSEDHSIRLWNAADGKMLRQLDGHTNMVWCLAFSPGGQTLASGGFDNSLRLWSPQSGVPLQELKGHSDVVTTVAYLADSRGLVSGSYDKTLKLWTAKAPAVPPLADLHAATTKGGTRFALLTPDSTALIAGNNNRDIKFYDLKSGELTETLQQLRGIASGALSNDGKLLVTTSYGKEIYLWDVPGRKSLGMIDTGHTESRGIAISPDGQRIAAGAKNGVITIWDVASREKVHEFAKMELPVIGLAFSPDGRLLASATGNWQEWRKPGEVKLWNVESGSELASLPGTKSKMSQACFSADGKTLLACGSQAEILVYDVEKRAIRTTITTSNEVTHLLLLPDQRTIAASLYGGRVALYDLASRKQIADYSGHRLSKERYIFHVDASADGSVIASAASDGHVHLWPAPSARIGAKALASVQDDPVETFAVAWLPSGEQLVTGSKDKTIELRDAKTLEPVRSLTGHSGMVFRLAAATSGNWIASASSDGTVRRWDVATGQELKGWHAHGEKLAQVRSLAISPDDKMIAAGNWHGETYVWNVADGELVRMLPKQALPVTGVAFSPDGARLATSTGNWREAKTRGEIVIWDLASGEKLERFGHHTGEIKGVAFDGSGQRLLSFGSDSTARLVDLETKQEAAVYQRNNQIVTAGAFVGNDRWVALADNRGKVWLWDWRNDIEVPLAGHRTTVSMLAASSDGSRLASAGFDGMVHVWPSQAGTAQDDSAAGSQVALVKAIRRWPAKAEVSTGEAQQQPAAGASDEKAEAK